jgi:predicted NAD/FAD-dependent oxidoreductase
VNKKRVLVIGGGPAGLTVALRLSANGYAVTLLERRAEVGGRLLTESQEAISPVIWGWHSATRSLLQTLGAHDEPQTASPLGILLPDGQMRTVYRPWLPGLVRVLATVATFGGLPLGDRWRLLNRLEKGWEQAESPDSDVGTLLDSRTAAAWLTDRGQSEAAIRQAWDPISRFLVGEQTDMISAAAFTSALWQCVSSRSHGRMALLHRSLRLSLLAPILDGLRRADVAIQPETTAEQIRCDAQRVTEVQLANGQTLSADWFVSAVPFRQLAPLLPERAVTRFSYFQQLGQLQDAPALVLHLWVPQTSLSPRVMLLSERPFHWLVIRPDPTGAHTHVTCVITGRSPLLELDDERLRDLACAELVRAIPQTAAVAVSRFTISRDSGARLLVQPGTAALRPLQQSPFLNFLVAGDWTDTGIPPTLESAIRSGDRCAEAIMGKATG